ncbi:MAG: aminoacyl-tRNA hydrolase [Nevskia sp.]|nr:aminoacyl-tRNA hydrolase [Nevskia sp.]
MADSPIRAVVGLGNPGAEYERTRHNAGFWFVDRLAEAAHAGFRVESKFLGALAKARVGGQDLLLLKPATFMNRSGQAAQALAAFYKLAPEQILVAHDELDLPPGTARLKRGGGHGGHNGLRSLHQHLGEAYARLRIGIGHPGHKDRVLEYVLNRPGAADQAAIDDALARAQAALQTLLASGWDKAAQQLHTDAEKAARPPKAGKAEPPGD